MGKRKTIVIHEIDGGYGSDGKLTAPIIIICMAVASAGVMFGYETGVYGVTKTQPFLQKFFPSVFRRMKTFKQNPFCVFNSPTLSTYTSSLYVSGVFSALLAGQLTTCAGRKGALIVGGILYLIGVSLQALAVNLLMLIMGRIIIGFGIGFTNQAAPMYLVEMAPTKWRGAIATGFPLFFEIGMFTSRWIGSFFIQIYPNDSRCWRIPMSLSALPAFMMTVIAFFIPDTPSSLIQRGKAQAALRSLNQVRSFDVDTENELNYLIKYHEAMRIASEKRYRLLFDSKYRHQLLLTVAVPAFRQSIGMHVILSFGPMLYKLLDISFKQMFLASFMHGSIVILSVLVATYLIDRVGRRMLLLEGGLQIFICHLVLAIIIASELDSSGTPLFSKRSAMIALFLATSINAAFAWSWGTVNLILSCELLSMEVRAAGQGLVVAINFAFQFLITQSMLPTLCNLKYGAFFFYAALVLTMTIVVFFFVPETKGIPLESMEIIWSNHWYWKRFIHGTNTLLHPEKDDDQFELR